MCVFDAQFVDQMREETSERRRRKNKVYIFANRVFFSHARTEVVACAFNRVVTKSNNSNMRNKNSDHNITNVAELSLSLSFFLCVNGAGMMRSVNALW